MNKRQREKNKQIVAAVREITYQEAWNKIAEYMNSKNRIGFCIHPWTTDSVLDGGSENKFCLVTIEDGKYVNHFEADKEWH